MKIFTDWANGNPPKQGWWLAGNEEDLSYIGHFYWWDGERWCWFPDTPMGDGIHPTYWRGLAFNPESAFKNEVRMFLGRKYLAKQEMILIEEFSE